MPSAFAAMCPGRAALGAIEAIAAANKTGRIKVIGFDALEDAKKAIAEGKMEASVAQSPRDRGRIADEQRANHLFSRITV